MHWGEEAGGRGKGGILSGPPGVAGFWITEHQALLILLVLSLGCYGQGRRIKWRGISRRLGEVQLKET